MTRTVPVLIAALVFVAGCGSSEASAPSAPPIASSSGSEAAEAPPATSAIATTTTTTTTVTGPVPTAPASTTVPAFDVEGGVDGPVAFWRFTDSEAGEEALVEGPLVIEDGCAFVGLGVETTLMLWAYGTSWDAGTESIVFPNGTTAVAGDIVSAGGGSASINDLDNITSNELVTEALARCAPDGGVFVVQSDVDVNNPFG